MVVGRRAFAFLMSCAHAKSCNDPDLASALAHIDEDSADLSPAIKQEVRLSKTLKMILSPEFEETQLKSSSVYISGGL